jgi:hypothetical protein
MKKRIPTLVLFGVVFLVFSILLGWKSCAGNKNNPDRDYDGVPNIKDSCPDEYAKTTNGCPVETKSQLGTDKDKDGRFAEFQKDTALFDPNDNNACIPNHRCEFCDEDGDGLTYPQEIAKKTKPTKPDTDGDGLNDKMDRCPLEYGLEDNEGCVLIIDAMLRKTGNTINWNPELFEYVQSLELIVIDIRDENNVKTFQITNGKTFKIPKIYRGKARLVVRLNNSRVIRITNCNIEW